MLAPKEWVSRYEDWNRKWGAPFGMSTRKLVPKWLRYSRLGSLLSGVFAYQVNNDTRIVEYPWAFEALELRPGLKILEIGGSLSGFQFVLDKVGCEVVNVDPGEAAHGRGWPIRTQTIDLLNRNFGTKVQLKNCFLRDAGLASESFDRVISVSVLEHIPEIDLEELLKDVYGLLIDEGLFVVTLDLFCDIYPFSSVMSNEFGQNVSVRWMLEASGLELIHGDTSELFGFPDFNIDKIMNKMETLYVGKHYPVMVQTIVLKKSKK